MSNTTALTQAKTALQQRQAGNGGAVAVTVKQLLAQTNYQQRFKDILGEKAQGFVSSIINLVNSNTNLQKCSPDSVIMSAVVAATLDLPVDKNLGFSWIIPYGQQAQFQMGWKGYVQLAIRTGLYKNINVIELYEGQLQRFDPLTEEYDIDWDAKKSDTVTHIAAYFELLTGYRKTWIWSVERLMAHGKRFSKAYYKKDGAWTTSPEEMCKKTLLSLLLRKYGVMSVEMRKAITVDHAVIHSDNVLEAGAVEYVDAEVSTIEQAEPVSEMSVTAEPPTKPSGELEKPDGYSLVTLKSAAQDAGRFQEFSAATNSKDTQTLYRLWNELILHETSTQPEAEPPDSDQARTDADDMRVYLTHVQAHGTKDQAATAENYFTNQLWNQLVDFANAIPEKQQADLLK